jgi:hypothetical protein
LHSALIHDRNEAVCRIKRKTLLNKKTTFLALSVLMFASLTASAQSTPGRNQRVNNPASGANSPTGAEYAAVSVARGAGGAYNQGNIQGNSRRNPRQQGRMQRGAEFVAVSIAPRR